MEGLLVGRLDTGNYSKHTLIYFKFQYEMQKKKTTMIMMTGREQNIQQRNYRKILKTIRNILLTHYNFNSTIYIEILALKVSFGCWQKYLLSCNKVFFFVSLFFSDSCSPLFIPLTGLGWFELIRLPVCLHVFLLFQLRDTTIEPYP